VIISLKKVRIRLKSLLYSIDFRFRNQSSKYPQKRQNEADRY